MRHRAPKGDAAMPHVATSHPVDRRNKPTSGDSPWNPIIPVTSPSKITQHHSLFDSLSRSGRGCWKVASPTSSISSLIYIIVKWAENGWRMVAVGEAKLTIPEYSANLCDTCRPKYHRTSTACCWHPIARGNSHIFWESTCWVARRSYPNWSPTTGDETGYDCHDMLKNHGKKNGNYSIDYHGYSLLMYSVPTSTAYPSLAATLKHLLWRLDAGEARPSDLFCDRWIKG